MTVAAQDIVSVIWIVLGLILSVLKVIVSVAAYFMNMDEWICMAIIVAFVFATILIDNRLMGIIKTVVFILVIIACLL
ncbi:MAG: hypothetical protein ACLTDF_10770 [Coprococcus sp.]